MGSLPQQAVPSRTIRTEKRRLLCGTEAFNVYEGTQTQMLHTDAQKPLWPPFDQPIRASLSLRRQLTSWRFSPPNDGHEKNNLTDVAIKILLTSRGLGFHYSKDHYGTFSLRRSQLKTMLSSRKRRLLNDSVVMCTQNHRRWWWGGGGLKGG